MNFFKRTLFTIFANICPKCGQGGFSSKDNKILCKNCNAEVEAYLSQPFVKKITNIFLFLFLLSYLSIIVLYFHGNISAIQLIKIIKEFFPLTALFVVIVFIINVRTTRLRVKDRNK